MLNLPDKPGCSGFEAAEVAVKEIEKSRLKQQYVVKNLKREAQILFKLNHPCVLKLFQTIQSNDYYYLVTEAVPGKDLSHYLYLQPRGYLLENQSRRFAAQLFSAVDHLHKHSVVHRDLKPENIIVNTRKNQIKLVDFGLSNTWNKKTPLLTRCGSPEYAAPELFVDIEGYGPEVDLWSLGVILYVMATGQLPFRVKISSAVRLSPMKKAVALYHQIIGGLTTRHLLCMINYSKSFTSLLQRLLVPNSTERITIKYALKHPWIIENSKNIVRANRKIKFPLHMKILELISTLENKTIDEVTSAFNSEPYGKIGGLYNIIVHNNILRV